VSDSVTEGVLGALRAAREFRPEGFVRLELGLEPIGWLRRDHAERLRRWPELFAWEGERVRLSEALGEEAVRTRAIAEVTRALAEEGAVRGWRGETYAVYARGRERVLFHIERAAMRFFGLTASAAHLNGYCGKGGALRVFTGRRAATKSIDPGKLDTLVAGGVPSGQDAWQTLLRECGEEAGIARSLAEQARSVGVLQVCHEVPEGLHSESLHAHDLALPPDFVPRNSDGEVSEFLLLRPEALLARVARGDMTLEAGLVAVDFMLRHELLRHADRSIAAAVEACRRS
jgi:8-oxo-dGTP pyrophosphatase MutT (NUDIX family)